MASFTIAGSTLKIQNETQVINLSILELPQNYRDWFDRERRSMYKRLLRQSSSVKFFSSHLPVLVTQSKDRQFPSNCTSKGVGFIPKEEYLPQYIELFQKTIKDTKNRPWKETMEQRIKAVSSFYFDHEKIDYRTVSSLEIFEKTTFNNIKQNPLVSLLYTGTLPTYISFQLNCAVDIVGPSDLRYMFIKLARVMFEYNDFHITQTQFPYAYIFWISEVLDKTPFPVPEKSGISSIIKAEGDLTWEQDALEAVGRAPGMVQKMIKRMIEKYAKEQGVSTISTEVVREAREQIEGRVHPLTEKLI